MKLLRWIRHPLLYVRRREFQYLLRLVGPSLTAMHKRMQLAELGRDVAIRKRDEAQRRAASAEAYVSSVTDRLLSAGLNRPEYSRELIAQVRIPESSLWVLFGTGRVDDAGAIDAITAAVASELAHKLKQAAGLSSFKAIAPAPEPPPLVITREEYPSVYPWFYPR